MRTNLPVSQEEHLVPPGIAIVSKTDLRGVITYANDAFVDISGYSREELIGQPHNLLRHPDMPPQAFAHMWATLKKGNPWKGIVKNRTRDGGFYWVKAVVVPVRKDNETIGYMSVRETASRDEIAAAERTYRKLAASGEPIKANPLHNLLTIKTGFLLGSLFVIFLMVMGGILGIGGLMLSNGTVETLYKNRIVTLIKIGQMDAEVRQITEATANGHPAVPLPPARTITIARLLAELEGTPLPPSGQAMVHGLQAEFTQLNQLLNAAQEADPADGNAAAPLLQASLGRLQNQLGELGRTVQAISDDDYMSMRERNLMIGKIALAGIVVGILAVLVVGHFFIRDIVTPLHAAIRSFDRIAQGDLTGEVEVFGKGETGQLIRASAVMQMHLKVITDEICLVAKGIQAHCGQLNRALFEISDHSEIQHDRLSQARSTLTETQSFSLELEQMLGRLHEAVQGGGGGAGEHAAELVARIENAIRLQSFAFEDFLARVDQLAELVVDNRQDTQAAYAMSERLQDAAGHLNELVSYFSTTQPPQASSLPQETAVLEQA